MSSGVNKKTREYYLSLLALTGEIISMKAYEHAPTAPTTAGDELRLMKKDRLIRYHSHQDRVRTFRISDPAGFDAIAEIDPRLRDHAEMIVGKKGSRYQGSREYRIKKRKEAVLMQSLLSEGIIVDGVRLEQDKKYSILSSDLRNAEEIIRTAPEDESLFLSGLLLKHRESSVTLSRREMSITTGALFSKGGIYNTYCVGSANFRWFGVAETTAASEIIRLYERAKSVGKNTDRRFRAIIYTDTFTISKELIAGTLDKNKKIDPTAIFRLTYIVPMEDKEHAACVTSMLTVPDWRRKSDEILGLSPTGRYDGKTEDGKPIYNLLCCNLARLCEISTDIKRERCKLILHDWQKKILEEIYEIEIDSTTLTSRHFRGLYLMVQKK